LSILDIRELVYTGELSHFDTIRDTNGGTFVAGHEPLWARPIENDPVAMWCCGGDITCGISDDEFEAMIADLDLEDDFFEGMPPESLPMQYADCGMQAEAVY